MMKSTLTTEQPNKTVERIKGYLERIPEGAQDAWIRAAYEVYLEKRLDPERSA